MTSGQHSAPASTRQVPARSANDGGTPALGISREQGRPGRHPCSGNAVGEDRDQWVTYRSLDRGKCYRKAEGGREVDGGSGWLSAAWTATPTSLSPSPRRALPAQLRGSDMGLPGFRPSSTCQQLWDFGEVPLLPPDPISSPV